MGEIKGGEEGDQQQQQEQQQEEGGEGGGEEGGEEGLLGRVDDSFREEENWEHPTSVNPGCKRTLKIEYWDRTRECKERKWDHMVRLGGCEVLVLGGWVCVCVCVCV